MSKFKGFIGLDVHKDTIAVAEADNARVAPVERGTVANTPRAVDKLIRRLSPKGEVLSFCYEAGPCGYGLYRQIMAAGHDCVVVAPSLIPRRPGDRIKTDRRDALMLARLHRSDDLTAVWVPDEEQEAMRDLTRARVDMKRMEQKARQQLGAFMLRLGHHYRGKTKWTKAHFRWLEQLKLATPIQQIVLQEYVDAVKAARTREASLRAQMQAALKDWLLAPVVDNLIALRGLDIVAAMTLIAELGDLKRFQTPRQLMAYLGLVPSEHSSGPRRRRGAITKAGNTHARRMLIEAAWSYRFPARRTAHIRRKQRRASSVAKAISWEAQKRLNQRYRHLLQRGKCQQQTITAVARELAGFIWAVAHDIAPAQQS